MKQQELKELIRSIMGSKAKTSDYFILRAEAKQEWGMRLSNGRFEKVSTGWENGMGVQAFTSRGACGFAAANSLGREIGQELMSRALTLAKRNEGIGAELNREIWLAPSIEHDQLNTANHDFEEYSLDRIQEMVLKLHQRLKEHKKDFAWQTSYRQIEDIWCIGRSDGSLVSFVIPRAVLMHQATVRYEGKAQSTLVHRSGTDIGVLLSESEDFLLQQKASERADFAFQVCKAPQLPSGNYPLIIDYGLAKGLAHEAFGHAVESDHMQESVLAENGRLKKGLKVARKGVHIIDGPLDGDWAFQPYSANGLERKTVTIVQDGILETGLGDIFSAREAGMEVSGAGRAEDYSYIPLPRMSNIRLLSDNILALEPSSNLQAEIQAIRDTLKAHGEIKPGAKNLLLLGYRGGQVNPKSGDFVFQCEGIVDVADPDLPVYQPSIFSGKILSALQAIRAGLGEGCYGAIGTCGKSGQSVPSSGGSHRYLLMDADPQVTLGGKK